MNTAKRKCFKVTDTKPGSDVTANMASALAIGSILFKEKDLNYSNKLLDIAIKMFKFADDYKAAYINSVPDANANYASYEYWDELIEAAVILYKATLLDSYKTLALNYWQTYPPNFTY